LPHAVTLDGTYDGDGPSPIAQEGHTVLVVAGVGYSCWRHRSQHDVAKQ